MSSSSDNQRCERRALVASYALSALERQGVLRRVHGGAIPVGRLEFEPGLGVSQQLENLPQYFGNVSSDGLAVWQTLEFFVVRIQPIRCLPQRVESTV